MNNDYASSKDENAEQNRQAAQDVRASRENLVPANRPLTASLGGRTTERAAEPLVAVVREEAKARELPSVREDIAKRIAQKPELAY